MILWLLIMIYCVTSATNLFLDANTWVALATKHVSEHERLLLALEIQSFELTKNILAEKKIIVDANTEVSKASNIVREYGGHHKLNKEQLSNVHTDLLHAFHHTKRTSNRKHKSGTTSKVNVNRDGIVHTPGSDNPDAPFYINATQSKFSGSVIAENITTDAGVNLDVLDSSAVKTTGNQTIAGVKTFSSDVTVPNLVTSGTVDGVDVSDLYSTLLGLQYAVVLTTGDQTITGVKTFSSDVTVPNLVTSGTVTGASIATIAGADLDDLAARIAALEAN